MREILRRVIIDRVINSLLGGLTLHPASMHCPSWDDTFVSSSGLICLAVVPVNVVYKAVRTIVDLASTLFALESICSGDNNYV